MTDTLLMPCPTGHQALQGEKFCGDCGNPFEQNSNPTTPYEHNAYVRMPFEQNVNQHPPAAPAQHQGFGHANGDRDGLSQTLRKAPDWVSGIPYVALGAIFGIFGAIINLVVFSLVRSKNADQARFALVGSGVGLVSWLLVMILPRLGTIADNSALLFVVFIILSPGLVALGLFFSWRHKENLNAENIAKLPPTVAYGLNSMNEFQRQAFFNEYTRLKKRTSTAYLMFFLFYGGVYAYTGNWGMQILYWVTGGGFGIWALYLLFRTPKVIADNNAEIAQRALSTLSVATAFNQPSYAGATF